MKVLLSIKPEFVSQIFSGQKRYEFRKVLPQSLDVKTIVVYATRPIGMIVGEFDILHVVAGDPAHVWSQTSNHAGISREFFDQYFEGRPCAYAFAIGAVREYENPVDPAEAYENFYPPQSFMYLDKTVQKPLAALEQARLI